MKRLVPIMAATLAAPACDASVSTTCMAPIAGAEIRLPVVPGRPGAGYFEINAEPGRGDLVSVSAPRIGRIEMHETIEANGVSSMRRLERMTPNDCDRFATTLNTNPPRHLMLFNVDPTLRPGDQVVLTFHFERGEPRRVATPVRAAGGEHGGH